MTSDEYCRKLVELPAGYYRCADSSNGVVLIAMVSCYRLSQGPVRVRGSIDDVSNSFHSYPDEREGSFLQGDTFPQRISKEQYTALMHTCYPDREIWYLPND